VPGGADGSFALVPARSPAAGAPPSLAPAPVGGGELVIVGQKAANTRGSPVALGSRTGAVSEAAARPQLRVIDADDEVLAAHGEYSEVLDRHVDTDEERAPAVPSFAGRCVARVAGAASLHSLDELWDASAAEAGCRASPASCATGGVDDAVIASIAEELRCGVQEFVLTAMCGRLVHIVPRLVSDVCASSDAIDPHLESSVRRGGAAGRRLDREAYRDRDVRVAAGSSVDSDPGSDTGGGGRDGVDDSRSVERASDSAVVALRRAQSSAASGDGPAVEYTTDCLRIRPIVYASASRAGSSLANSGSVDGAEGPRGSGAAAVAVDASTTATRHAALPRGARPGRRSRDVRSSRRAHYGSGGGGGVASPSQRSSLSPSGSLSDGSLGIGIGIEVGQATQTAAATDGHDGSGVPVFGVAIAQSSNRRPFSRPVCPPSPVALSDTLADRDRRTSPRGAHTLLRRLEAPRDDTYASFVVPLVATAAPLPAADAVTSPAAWVSGPWPSSLPHRSPRCRDVPSRSSFPQSSTNRLPVSVSVAVPAPVRRVLLVCAVGVRSYS
jgi:hypothetical protein